MKLYYKTSDALEFEIEGSGQKEIFKELAIIQEIFGEKQCGLCDSQDIRFTVRTVESNDYYELRCNKCGGILSYGQHKKGGTLFPKRKDENNSYLPNKGWYKWNSNK